MRHKSDHGFDFALGFARTGTDIFSYFHEGYPLPFDKIEIDWRQFYAEGFARFAKNHNISIVNVRNISDRSLVENVCSETETIKNAFLEGVVENIDGMERENSFASAAFSFDFPIELAFGDAVLDANATELAKRIATELYRRGKKFFINIRLPCPAKIPSAFYNSFVSRIMLPNTSLSISANPHEIAGKIDPATLLAPFRFTASKLDLTYEPETGNRISKKLFETWTDALSASGFEGVVVISPSVNSCEVFFDVLRDMTSNLFNVNIH